MEPVDNFWSTYAAIIRQNSSWSNKSITVVQGNNAIDMLKEAMLYICSRKQCYRYVQGSNAIDMLKEAIL
jgi:hypothetical protein